MAGGGGGPGTSVDAHRIHLRPRIDIHHHEGQPAEPGRLDVAEVLDPGEDEAVHHRRGRTGAVQVGADQEVDASLVAGLRDAEQELLEDRVAERVVHPQLPGGITPIALTLPARISRAVGSGPR